MKEIHIVSLNKKKMTRRIIILMASLLMLYLLGCIYFMNHFFFHTFVNGVNVSSKKYKAADDIIRKHLSQYKLEIIGRNGTVDYLTGQDIGLSYNEKTGISVLARKQKPYQWVRYTFGSYDYDIDGIYLIQKSKLDNKIKQLGFLHTAAVEPRNVSFKYIQGSYKVIGEVYGNKIDMNKLYKVIEDGIAKGDTRIDLEKEQCYQTPAFTLQSKKTAQTKKLLDQYTSTRITYLFGDKQEVLDSKSISKWLKVDSNLDVIINKYALLLYVKGLSKKYDTVGVERSFRTSTGSTIEITGGLYGWQINQDAEIEALTNHIQKGEVIEREPIYKQTASKRGDDDIGDTYLEINITRQHLWFYKDGVLIAHGPVVTGNPNRGFSTVLGTYMIVYKQRNATLVGPGYEAKVNYWMPFFGGIGVHDATWRSSFGGEIFRHRGSHGCVNAPFPLAKTIFEHIEDGTPVILYEEKNN